MVVKYGSFTAWAIKITLCVGFLCCPHLGSLLGQVYNVLDYGAKGDGKTLSTQPIQAALDACKEAGGGTVLIPPGQFLCGTVRVYSHTTLRLSAGAVLLGSDRWEDYNPAHPHLIWGDSLTHFKLVGEGIIDGQGEAFFNKTEVGNWLANEDTRPRPWIDIAHGQHIHIQDISLIRSPSHVLNLAHCETVFISGIHIANDLRSPNTDGIDIKGCRNVLISDCFISTGDDAICLKSAIGAVENVVVTNCILRSDDAALKLGTGSAYPIRYCQFSNNVITGTRYGIALFMNQGGTFEHCRFSNTLIATASRHATEYPIFIDIDKRAADSPLGQINNIQFSQLNIVTRGNILVAGQPESPIRDISFEDVTITFPSLSNLEALQSKPRGNKDYENLPGMVDYSTIPAHLTFGQVAGLRLRNIRLSHQFSEPSMTRHFLHLEDVQGVNMSGLLWPEKMRSRKPISKSGKVRYAKSVD